MELGLMPTLITLFNVCLTLGIIGGMINLYILLVKAL